MQVQLDDQKGDLNVAPAAPEEFGYQPDDQNKYNNYAYNACIGTGFKNITNEFTTGQRESEQQGHSGHGEETEQSFHER